MFADASCLTFLFRVFQLLPAMALVDETELIYFHIFP